MQLKNKKRAMMVLMSLMLATSGCGKKDDYKANGFDQVKKIMEDSEFYQTEMFDETNEEAYTPFYQNYLRLFAKYMTEEQYEDFLSVVKGMNNQEHYDFPNTYYYLNSMFDITPTKEGRGFFQCFNSRILGEHILLADLNEFSKITPHITTLRSVVNNDEFFFKSIYSANIDEVIDCICESTGFKDRELVEELFLKMDLYYDITESEESKEYLNGELKSAYEARIREIIGLIIEAKCAKDEKFNNSLYARLLKESSYFNKDSYDIIPSICEDTFFLGDYSSEEGYRLYEIDSKYLYEDISLEEIRKIKVNQIIEQSMNPRDDDYTIIDTMKLMMSIIDVDIFNNQELPDSNAIRLAMYENLKGYFTSVDDFNTFFLKLYDTTTPALERYFDVLTKRINEDGISYNDFIRYLCLVNYNKTRTYNHIYLSGTYEEMKANYVPDDEIRLMKESEWDPIAYNIQENYFLGSIPYMTYFESIENVLANNDLGYDLIFNPDCEYTWSNNEANVTNLEHSSVLSVAIRPKKIENNSESFIYYEIPEYYEDAKAVETFYNIDTELITRDVKGFKTTIEDPETGEEKLVFVAGITGSEEDLGEIRFILDYSLFMENTRKNSPKGLYLGGNYE